MSKDEYLITDTPLKALTVFAMPMILGSFFQQIYNMADSLLYKEDFAWMKKTNLVEVKLSFPLYYIVPPVFTNSDKGKYKGKKIL